MQLNCLWISYNYYTHTAVYPNGIFGITEGSTVDQCDNHSYTEYSRFLCTAHFITEHFLCSYRIVVSAPNGTATGGVIPNTGLIFTCPLQPGECEGLTGNGQGNDNRLFDTQSKVKCVKVKHHIHNYIWWSEFLATISVWPCSQASPLLPSRILFNYHSYALCSCKTAIIVFSWHSSLIPRPSLFLLSVSVHNNTWEGKTGIIVNANL